MSFIKYIFTPNYLKYPLWRVGALAGSPAEEMAHIFVWAPFLSIIVPWKYVFQNYVWPQSATANRVAGGRNAAQASQRTKK